MEVVESIKTNKSLYDIAVNHPVEFIKYSKGIERVHLYLSTVKREWKTTIIVLWGESGTGKSILAQNIAEQQGIPFMKPDGKWWDGYRGEEVVIIDDYNGHAIEYREMLRIMDRYPHKVEIKGGFIEFLAKIIIVTSNFHPNKWYENVWGIMGMEKPFQRRLSLVLELKNPVLGSLVEQLFHE